ncbi:MAG: sulfate transporter family protein [Alphaproteobacteria bacterium]|nr:MAG: sulfate transporter family protein [Alphaproteobacteria bacterium]
MLDAAIKALAQMASPPFRALLIRSIALAIVLLIVLGIGIDRGLVALVERGGAWIEIHAGPGAHTPVNILEWMVAIAAGLGIVAGAVFLMPAVTALVASFFVDAIAEQVERVHYPADPVGTAVPIGTAILEGVQAALLAILIYLCAVPFLLVAGLGLLIFFLATAYVQGRIYFELAAMRFHPAAEAKRLRKHHAGTLFVAGLFIAAFVSIPVLNLATPLFATAFMVHVHKQIVRRRESTSPPGEVGSQR